MTARKNRSLTDAELIRMLEEAAAAAVPRCPGREPTAAERAEFNCLLEAMAKLENSEEQELREAAEDSDEDDP